METPTDIIASLTAEITRLRQRISDLERREASLSSPAFEYTTTNTTTYYRDDDV